MILHDNFKRVVRIQGIPNDPTGRNVRILDAETNEPIKHVFRAVVTLEVNALSEVTLTYHESDAASEQIMVGSDGNLIHKSVTTLLSDFDITAFEVENWEEVFDREFCLYEPDGYEYENAEEKVKAFIRVLLDKRGIR